MSNVEYGAAYLLAGCGGGKIEGGKRGWESQKPHTPGVVVERGALSVSRFPLLPVARLADSGEYRARRRNLDSGLQGVSARGRGWRRRCGLQDFSLLVATASVPPYTVLGRQDQAGEEGRAECGFSLYRP